MPRFSAPGRTETRSKTKPLVQARVVQPSAPVVRSRLSCAVLVLVTAATYAAGLFTSNVLSGFLLRASLRPAHVLRRGARQATSGASVQKRSAELARVILDDARSNTTHIIPRVVRDALQRLSIPEFVDVVLASPFVDVELPPGSGKHASVYGFGRTPDFWQGAVVGSWEPVTFRVLAAVLTARPGVVIDFGAWIGPTLLAAAHLPSTRVYGMEVDPVAFTQLALNVAANAAVAAKSHVFFVGISDAISERVITMNACDEGIGDSCSTMNAPNKNGDSLFRLAVQMLPLPTFVEAAGIRLEELSLVKFDAEGAEVFILPTIVDWMAKWPGSVKPAFWLSLHTFTVSVPWFDRVAPFMRLFKYGYVENGTALELLWDTRKAAMGPKDCPVTCTYLLSDVHVAL